MDTTILDLIVIIEIKDNKQFSDSCIIHMSSKHGTLHVTPSLLYIAKFR